MSRIFVSHASADAAFADEFVDCLLRNGCNLGSEDLLYTSGPDTGIRSGDDLMATVRSEVSEATLVVALITPTYQTRPVCIAELGAAWGRTGNLMPLMVPGFARTDLQGVLNGMTIRTVNETAALDELHDRIKEVSGIAVKAATWSRHKTNWLRRVDDLVDRLPTPAVATVADLEQARRDRDGAQEAVGELEDLVRKLERENKILRGAKDLSSVIEDLLPTDETERFEELEKQLERSVRTLDKVVWDAIWADRFGSGLKYPTEDYRAEEAEANIAAGFLSQNDDGVLWPDDDSDVVKEALEARDRMQRFLTEETSDRFKTWFRGKYGFGPDLSRKGVWEQLI